MFAELLRRWRQPRISTRDDLGRFLERNAWLVAQKCVVGYCHVKTQLPIQELIKDKPFAEAYDVAIWEAYAAALADLVLVAETFLRPAATGQGPALAAALAGTFESLVAAHPRPSHRPEGWADEVATLRRRLEAALAEPPRSIRQISKTASARIFATLPIHERLRAPDAPAVEASVQFVMVGLAHEFEKRLDYAAIVADALAAHP
jgi:hypothetical protein